MPDIPTKYSGYNKVDTTTDQYIQFDSSSAYKDVSQTTVPFIDAQPVSPRPASWLGGAGLYHKVSWNSFIVIKINLALWKKHKEKLSCFPI